jgi:hypothetical protein
VGAQTIQRLVDVDIELRRDYSACLMHHGIDCEPSRRVLRGRGLTVEHQTQRHFGEHRDLTAPLLVEDHGVAGVQTEQSDYDLAYQQRNGDQRPDPGRERRPGEHRPRHQGSTRSQIGREHRPAEASGVETRALTMEKMQVNDVAGAWIGCIHPFLGRVAACQKRSVHPDPFDAGLTDRGDRDRSVVSTCVLCDTLPHAKSAIVDHGASIRMTRVGGQTSSPVWSAFLVSAGATALST